jgi:hypothetical protein
MTDTTPNGDDPAETARRMATIAAGLQAAGLTAQVNQTLGVFDLTASLDRAIGKPVEIIVDEDGYVEITYWNDADATPAQIVATITRALAAIAVSAPG